MDIIISLIFTKHVIFENSILLHDEEFAFRSDTKTLTRFNYISSSKWFCIPIYTAQPLLLGNRIICAIIMSEVGRGLGSLKDSK